MFSLKDNKNTKNKKRQRSMSKHQYPNKSIDEVIQAAQDGDENAFSELLTDHYDLIYRFALKWCADPTDAEDITQQACIKLAQGISQFRFESAFSSWLYRLVINCAKDWLKAQKRNNNNKNTAFNHDVQAVDKSEEEVDSADENAGDLPSYSSQAETLIYLQQLLEWSNRLGDDFKETLILVFAQGLSHAETADILGVKESTISWRIHVIRKNLDGFTQQENSDNEK